MRSRYLKRIQDVVAASDRPLGPKEISHLANVKHATTRVYVRQLLRHGVLRQPFRGVYVMNPRYGVGRPPRIHNLRLSVSRAPVPRGVSTRIEVFGDVKIQVLFGGKRQKITGILSSNPGLDYTGCLFAIQRVLTIIKEDLGLTISTANMAVTSCEFNEDFQDLRLDGLSCVTVKSFLGSLERIYNKGAGLRSEVKVRPDSIEGILALLKGGVTPYHAIQGMFAVEKRLADLTSAIKFQNRGIQQLIAAFTEYLKRQDKDRHREKGSL